MLKSTLLIFALIAILAESSLDPFLRKSQRKNVRRFAAPAQTQRSRYQPRLRNPRIARRKYYFEPEFPPIPFHDLLGKDIKRDAIRDRSRNRNLNRRRRSQLRRNFVEGENSFGDESNYDDANNSYGDYSSDYDDNDYDSSYDPYHSYEPYDSYSYQSYDPYSYQSSYDPYYSSYDPYGYSTTSDPYSSYYYDPYSYNYNSYQSYQDPYYGIEQNTCVCQCGQCDDAGDEMDESIQCVINTCSTAIGECQNNSDCASALTSALEGGCEEENRSCDSGTDMCGENNTECSTKWDALVHCFGDCSVNDDDDNHDEYDTDNNGDRKYKTRTKRTKSKTKAKHRNNKAVVKTLLKQYRVATKNYI